MSAWTLGMEGRRARSLAVGVAIGSGLMIALSVGVAFANPLSGPERFVDEQFIWLVPVAAFIAVGSFISLNRPDNPIGWVFVWLGFFSAISFVLYAIGAGLLREGSAAAWVTVTADVLNTASIVTFVALAAHLFPNGEVVSPRWRWGVWAAFAAGALGGLSALLNGGWGGDPEQAAFISPLRDELGDVPTIVTSVFWPVMLLAWASAAVSLVVRYRRSRGIERSQMKWLVVPVMILTAEVVLLLPEGLSEVTIADIRLETIMASIGIASIPAAAAIAVVRHGLYDIDLVISRSLVVAGLGGFITVVYVLVVVGFGALVGAGDEPNLALQIVATALVAVLFQPVRQRLRQLADRLVYGHRASPYEVLATFSTGAGGRTEASLDSIARLLAEGTGADPATVWLRVGDRFMAVASSGNLVSETARSADAISADVVVPVVQDGETLGALSVSKPRGEQLSPQDEDLVARLAAGVGYILRNNLLTAELRARLEELKESRRRLVSAQDEARRRLERDLHDGAQQQLVALKVKLGLARGLAAKAGAEKTTQLLEQLSTDADEAVDTLRDMARGIYPPLLESEGLPTAVEAQARKAPIPVTVHAAGVGRHSKEVESAVYFCVLEALNNAVKYSEGGSVHIRLTEEDGVLSFTVEDDGLGFDTTMTSGGTGLQGMYDRLDTIDGVLQVDSKPGRGTVVQGRVRLVESGESTSDPEMADAGVANR